MRLTTFLTAASLALTSLLPASAWAQREGIPLRSGDLERLNPARVLIVWKKELRLDPKQLDTLESRRKAFDLESKRMADSVRKYQRMVTTAPPMLRRPPEAKPETRRDSLYRAQFDSTNRFKRDAYFQTVTTGRRDLAANLLALKGLFDENVVELTAVLTSDQRTGAGLVLEGASEEFTRRLRLANIR